MAATNNRGDNGSEHQTLTHEKKEKFQQQQKRLRRKKIEARNIGTSEKLNDFFMLVTFQYPLDGPGPVRDGRLSLLASPVHENVFIITLIYISEMEKIYYI